MSYRRQLYKRHLERKQGRTIYIVSMLIDGGKYREVAVTKEVYIAIGELTNQDRHLSHQDERHSEFCELSDESLYERASCKPRAAGDVAIDRLLARQALVAIKSLPPIQARRFILRNVLGLTYPEISKSEGCSDRAVKYSVDIATEKIRKLLNL